MLSGTPALNCSPVRFASGCVSGGVATLVRSKQLLSGSMPSA